MAKRHLFVSYAKRDTKAVVPIVEAVRREYVRRGSDVDVWLDVDNLTPGQRWEGEITRALRESVGLLVFVSPAAMQSEWVSREIRGVAQLHGRLIVPVILQHVPNLPLDLARRQWLDLSGPRDPAALQQAAQRIVDATEAHLRVENAPPPVSPAQARTIATTLAEEARRGLKPTKPDAAEPPHSVFLVHGHDAAALAEVEAYLSGVGVRTFILSRVRGAAQSLLQKFLKSAGDARFAIAISRQTTLVYPAPSIMRKESETERFNSEPGKTLYSSSASFTGCSGGRTSSSSSSLPTRYSPTSRGLPT